MSTPDEQSDLVLTRRLDDGTIDWISLVDVPQRIPADPLAAYALIDRADFEAPQTLVAERQGDDLVVEVEGTEVLVIGAFFASVGVAFYPTTDIAGGAGAFSGTPLTPDSPVVAAAPDGDQIVWSAGEDTATAGVTETSGAAAAATNEGGPSPLLWAGVAAGGLGLLALAGGGGGGGGGGGSNGGGGGNGGSGTTDTTPPNITSGATAAAIAENSGAGQIVYTAEATDDAGAVTYSLGTGGDEAAFSINSNSGAVTLTANPDFETQATYNFTVIATDAAGNAAEQAVSLSIDDQDDGVSDTTPPQITSGATAAAIPENTGAGQVVYTAAATDASTVTYSLGTGGDEAAFSIDPNSGAVTLTVNPDFETQPTYNFTVVATDAAGNSSQQAVSLSIEDGDDGAPSITSGATANAIDENSGTGQVVYTATATDDGTVTWSLSVGATAFSIDPTTGAVTLTGNPDYEATPSYGFTVVATDNDGNSSQQAVTLPINNLDEVAPTITSATTAAIDENTGAGQVVYTVTSTDDGDISGGTTYSLRPGGDAAAFSINGTTGAVILTGNPDFETQSSYTFSVAATDAAGNVSADQTVTLAVNDLDDVAPVITSGATATAINENSGAGQVVYSATATDDGAVTWSLAVGATAFSIDAATGAVTLTGNPDYEATPSYGFTVVATDTDGNSSQQAVTLPINNLDEVAPTITSGTTAAAITENSGAAQVVYTVTSTDVGDISSGTTTYLLQPGGDAAAFTINASTGAVTLTGNPDFETKSSYTFAVAARDAAGNVSANQTVTLPITDIADETPPTVTNLVLSASGVLNERLNAGDTVTVTVTMSENTVVDTAGGTPRVALALGSGTVFADYLSGSGTTSLVFRYTVQTGDTDGTGIAIPANALQANGGTLRDAAGNAAVLSSNPVADNPALLVDTTAPALSTSTPADNSTGVDVDANIVLTFTERVQAGSGNIILTNADNPGDTRTIAVTDTTQVTISDNQVTINPSSDLQSDSSYYVQIGNGALTDLAGNPYGGISDPTTLNFDTVDTVVVFDLVQGVNSSHSGRTFDDGISYTIYIRVDSNTSTLSTDGDGPGPADTWGSWSGGNNLGSDDRILLVGSGGAVLGSNFGAVQTFSTDSNSVVWQTLLGSAAFLQHNGKFSRSTGSISDVTLWNGSWKSNPNGDVAQLNEIYLQAMPPGVLTSQGLAT